MKLDQLTDGEYNHRINFCKYSAKDSKSNCLLKFKHLHAINMFEKSICAVCMKLYQIIGDDEWSI